jgi:hypothetical protein
MAEVRNGREPSSRLEKRGGYAGGKPASSMRPPAHVPSGSIKPTEPPKPKAGSN